MSMMRDRLRQSSPKLYESLERSWDVAWEEWLPAISPQKDSFNSYPHIRNLEIYLDKLVLAYESRTGKKNGLFSDLEAYVILSSILLHDIGRAIPYGDHWEESQKLIERNWSHLGIPNYELALSIAKICEAHDYHHSLQAGYNLDNLATVTIDPFGRIRERELGAVLILIDHIDGSIIRVMPDFIQEDKEVIGKFRRKIRGIDIDLDGGLIKVVLGEHWEPSPGTGYHLSPGLIWSINEDLLEVKNATFNNALPLADYLKKDSTAYPEDLKSAFNAITLSGPESNTFTVSKASIKKQWKKKYTTVKQRTLFQMIFKGRTPNFLKMLLAWRLLFVDREKRKDKDWTDRKNPLIELKKASSNNGPTGDLNRQIRLLKWKRLTLKMKYLVWLFSKRIKARKPAPPSSPPKAKNVSARIPDNILLAIVLGNTLENAVTLREVKEILQSIDLPLFGWCVEYKDRLYNWKGEETYEPIFSREFLKRTLDDMWFLSSRIFGANKLSYESLASQMREPDLLKVKSAVKRLWILSSSFPEKPAAPTTGDLKKELADGSVFWISDGYWRWSIKNRDQRHEVCTDANVDTMKTILENLGDPNGGIL